MGRRFIGVLSSAPLVALLFSGCAALDNGCSDAESASLPLDENGARERISQGVRVCGHDFTVDPAAAALTLHGISNAARPLTWHDVRVLSENGDVELRRSAEGPVRFLPASKVGTLGPLGDERLQVGDQLTVCAPSGTETIEHVTIAMWQDRYARGLGFMPTPRLHLDLAQAAAC